MADENYAIRVSFDGIDKAIGDIKTLQTAIGNIKAPVLNLGGTDASNIAVAALKKIQLEIDSLEKKKAQSGANDATRSAAFISQLEKQKAASTVRVSDGGDKEAARVAQELLRYKQQLAAIDAKLINPVDIANARALAAEVNKLNLDKIKKGFDDAAPVTFNQFIGATTEKARDLAEQLQNTSQTLERIGTTFNQVSSAANQAFLGFDTAKTKIATLSNESDAFAGVAVKLSGELKNQVTSTEILTAQYEILSSGFTNAADASEIARVSVLGAKAGFTDTATVADATTSILNAYGLAAGDAANVVDQLAVVQDKGKTTIGLFAGQLGKVAPIAASAGVSLNELNAAIASITIKGVKTETAVSGIRQAIVNLVKPTQSAQKELEAIGITNAATTLKTEGLTGVLNRLKAAGVTTSSQLSKIFTDIDGLTAVVPLLNDDLKNFNENLVAVANASGKAQTGFDIVTKSAEGKITTAINKINEALVNLGRGAQVAFAPLVAAVGAAVDVFNQLPAPLQTVIGGVIGLIGGVATLGAALTAIGAAAPAFIGGLKLFGIQAAASTVATTGLATANTVTATSFISLGVATKAAAAGFVSFATTSVSLTVALKGIGGILVGTGALFGTLAIKAVASITSIIVAVAPLALTLGAIFLAFEAVRNTANLFGEINSNKAEDAFDKILNKATAVDAKLKQATATSQSFTDKLAGGFDKVENPIQGAALAVTNLTNALIGAESGASKFGSQFGLITQQQLEAQKTAIAYSNAITTLSSGFQPAVNLIGKYGIGIDFERRATQLSIEEKKEYQKQLAATSERLKQEVSDLEAIGKQKGVDQAANKLEIDSRKTLIAQSDQKIAALKKEEEAVKTVSDAERDRAKQLRETQNQDTEKNIKRSFDDGKTKRDRENADAIKAIEEKNALAKADLDRKQALETEALKERQTLALQDKQRAFDETQNAKKLQLEDALDAKKRANEEKLNALKQAFDDKQNALKEQRAEKQRKDDEAFAAQRAQRDKQASEALSGAKQLISNEGAIATASPEDRAKLAAQLAEETRIRAQAAQQGQGGVQSQEQLVAQAKQLAQVSAIATKEEQAKVQLALDELEKANKAKQSELDKAEDAKRLLAQQESEKAFDLAQQEAKRAFDAQQKSETLNFETSVLKPEKQKIEAELRAEKLAFETGELAAIKKQQAAEERALQLQQTNEDNALKKAADAELEALKIKQKDAELAKDRAFEDAKIERERAFKEQQRALDKASAIEIQQILGKSAKQIIDAIAVTKGGNALSSALGVKGVETQTAKAADPMKQIKAGAIAALEAQPFNKVPAFASGVTNFKGGMALVGEQGAELVTLPRGSNVLPANQTKQIMNNNSGGNKTFNVNVTTAATNAVEVGLQVQKELARSMALSM
jgi:TP901 family phage tail tape measure protein